MTLVMSISSWVPQVNHGIRWNDLEVIRLVSVVRSAPCGRWPADPPPPGRSGRDATDSRTKFATARQSSAKSASASRSRASSAVVGQRRDQVRSALRRAPERLVAAPPGDLGVVPGEQHLGHVEAAPGRRLGVDGVLQQPVARATPRPATPALPMKPGSSRTTASMIASAATSPPLST